MSIFDDTSPSWAATPNASGNGANDGSLDALSKASAKAKAGYPQLATPATQASSENTGNQAGNGGFMGSVG